MMTPFQRKIVYLALIAALLIPLSLISRPATIGVDGEAGSAGGKLAQLRDEQKLGQAQIGRIDPTSSAIRYVSFGFHGLAACIYWNKVDEYEKQEDWISMSAVLKQLTVLQPYYVKVWRYQGWNVSYNVASKWDDYRDKFFWVVAGFKLLARGMDFNQLEPELPYLLGWTVAHKIGQSDERDDFRILFARDDELHKLDWAEWVHERDNWLFGKKYLERAQELVDVRGGVLRSLGAEPFNMQPALAQGQYAMALAREGTFGEKLRRAWQQAQVEWQKFGDREFPTADGFSIRFNDLSIAQQRLDEAVAKLDALIPGVREKIEAERRAKLTDEERRLIALPRERRSVRDDRIAGMAEARVRPTDLEAAEAADPQVRAEAVELARQVAELRRRVMAIKGERQAFVYDYWVDRVQMEATDEAIAAREMFYQAVRDSDEKPWAARKTFEQAFDLWRKIVDKYPEMVDDQTAYDVFELTGIYRSVLKQLDEPFDKSKFVLRDIIEKFEGENNQL